MKFDFPPRFTAADSTVQPGFDVLIAVTSARQASTPTARALAAGGAGTASLMPTNNVTRRCELLSSGRVGAAEQLGGIARFADIAIVPANAPTATDDTTEKMNGAFTTAFQPIVKHQNIYPKNDAARRDGDGPGME
jgi:hypothetical protein